MDTPRSMAAAAAGDAGSADWYRRSFDHAPIGVAIVAPDGRWLAMNPAMSDLLGVTEADLPALQFEATTHPDDLAADEELATEVLAGDRVSFSVEKRYRASDGTYRVGQSDVALVRDAGGTPLYFVCQLQDLSDRVAADAARQEAEDALRGTTAWYAALVAHSVDTICVIDAAGNITYASPTAQSTWADIPDLSTIAQVAARVHPDDRDRVEAEWARIHSAADRTHTISGRILMSTGDVRHIEVLATNRLDDPDVRGIIANVRDVTERAEASARLTWQAFHDPLTRLPNRALLGDRLAHAIERSRRHDDRVALLYIDLDRFKVVNDTMGHTAGDHLLVEVAGRILRAVRPDDTVARLGGDEFVVVTESVADPSAVVAMAERIGDEVRRAVIVPGGEVTVSASIGIAFDDGHEPDALLRDADIALYRAKQNGRDRFEVFDESLRIASLRRLATERELREGLEHDSLLVHFQPIVDLRSAAVIGCEALLRIPGPGGVLRSPSDHIEVADESGLIVPIGVLVLDEACAALARWRRDLGDRAPAHVTVNVTGRQLSSPALLSAVEKTLSRHDLEPWNLVIELTESTIIGADRATVHTVMSLDELGVGLAIDDFGTGYSSLAHLKRFPIQVLKLDRAFVSGLGTDRSDTEIVRAVVSLGEALGPGGRGRGHRDPRPARHAARPGLPPGPGLPPRPTGALQRARHPDRRRRRRPRRPPTRLTAAAGGTALSSDARRWEPGVGFEPTTSSLQERCSAS